MSYVNRLNYFLVILAMLVTVLPACSSGGGDDTPTVNDTTWDELVWDDSTVDRTRNWAD